MKSLGYVWVPGNSIYLGCEKGFFVAKYNMKASKKGFRGKGELVSSFPGMTQTYNVWYYSEDSNITPVSSAEGSPITSISQIDSISICSALQTTFRRIRGLENCSVHLITNNERMTIARNIEQVTSNWSSGTIGTGYIYSGHNDHTPSYALAADTNDNNGYYLTGQSSGNQRRTLTLTNGEVIWDLSGNVWEWANYTINAQDEPNDGTLPTAAGEWIEYSAITDLGTMNYNDLFLLTSDNYNSSNGIGRFFSDAGDTGARAMLFGGYWLIGTYAGLMALDLDNVPGCASYSIGLRCVVVP